MNILRIYLDTLTSRYQESTLTSPVNLSFDSVESALDSFFFSDKKKIAMLYVGKETYKVSKHLGGRFFRLYGWVHGQGWQIKLVNVDKGIIKAFFSA